MTQPHIDAGDLVVIGLVQEQHPERAQLYAQWRQLDWPILWDPFNTTGATAVPNAYLIDEHGVLRGKQLNQDSLAVFMGAEFEAPEEEPWAAGSDRTLVQSQSMGMSPDAGFYWGAISGMNWRRTARPREPGEFGDGRRNMDLSIVDGAIYEAHFYSDDSERSADESFRLGVLYRMRHDSEDRIDGDFQAAVDAWAKALELDPNQYIWRRRIQQYGPMSDKPYPFYGWIETAQREITERGETPVAIPQALTQAELGTEGSALVPGGEGEPVNPDPEGRITADDTGIITITTATTPDTQTPGSRRVLIEFATGEAGHWNNEAEPLTVWIDADALPAGWSVESPLLIHHLGDDPAVTSDEPRIIDFGLTHPADATGSFTLTGYALYNVCEAGDLGQCLYRRQAFEVVIELE